MEPFQYRDRQLYCEDVPVAELAARFGTPLYVYSQNAILETLKSLRSAFADVDPLVCYSVKANSNLGILQVMAEHGSGFDVVSGGELHRVKLAGGDPERTVFAGVGKTGDEIVAGLEAGVLMFNVESEGELEAIARVAAAMNRVAPIALRVNPDVDPRTHRYISTGKKESKFGMDIERSLRVAEAALAMNSVRMIGMHMHIGSQITTTEPYAGAVAQGVEVIGQLRRMGHPIEWYNMGGGFGIAYKKSEARSIAEFAAVILPAKGRGVSSGDRAGASNRGECGHPGQPCVIYQAVGRQTVPDPGCRHERFDPAGTLRVVPSDLAGGRRPGLARAARRL